MFGVKQMEGLGKVVCKSNLWIQNSIWNALREFIIRKNFVINPYGNQIRPLGLSQITHLPAVGFRLNNFN